jgi:hypothetical protein
MRIRWHAAAHETCLPEEAALIMNQIRECLRQAEDCARKAAAQTYPKLKEDFLDMKRVGCSGAERLGPRLDARHSHFTPGAGVAINSKAKQSCVLFSTTVSIRLTASSGSSSSSSSGVGSGSSISQRCGTCRSAISRHSASALSNSASVASKTLVVEVDFDTDPNSSWSDSSRCPAV